MSTKHRKNMTHIVFVWLALGFGFVDQLPAQDPGDEGSLYAKGFNILRVSFPTYGEVKTFSLKVSFDGETFHDTSAGLPRPWRLFRSINCEPERTTILVPVVACFGVKRFIFEATGTCWFHWKIDFQDEDIESIEVTQIAEVRRPNRVDLDFIAGLGDPDLVRAMFGDDIFERLTGNTREQFESREVRAVKVIGQLLMATRADEAEAVRPHGSIENAVKSADTLLALAKEFPESSYAPYAAYYAGCCYSAAGGDVLEKTMKERGIQDSSLTAQKLQALAAEPKAASHYSKAEEALTLAANRADLYLKPRAVYMQAVLVGMRGEWDEMERLLDKALAEAPGEGTVRQLVDGARRHLARVKQREQRQAGALEKD